jgi:hypothetical protein
MINKREIKIICTPEQREIISQELGVLKRDSVDNDDTRKRIIKKERMKEFLSRSPDYLDMLLMRMYFVLRPGNYKIVLTGGSDTYDSGIIGPWIPMKGEIERA